MVEAGYVCCMDRQGLNHQRTLTLDFHTLGLLVVVLGKCCKVFGRPYLPKIRGFLMEEEMSVSKVVLSTVFSSFHDLFLQVDVPILVVSLCSCAAMSQSLKSS